MKKVRDNYQVVTSLYFDIVLSGISYDSVKTSRNGANITIEGMDYKIETDVEHDKINIYCCNDNFKVAHDSQDLDLFYNAIDAIKLEMYQDMVETLRYMNTKTSRGNDIFLRGVTANRVLRVEEQPRRDVYTGEPILIWNM